MTKEKFGAEMISVPEKILADWQEIVNILAGMLNIPVALIMRLNKQDIEVFVASSSEENPYQPSSKELCEGSGLYCERVIKTKSMLKVPNALEDAEWCENPDIKIGMVSYLGFPILLPDGEPFGTLCVLDRKHNNFSDAVAKMMAKLRDLIESHLVLAYMNQLFGEKNQKLTDYLMELQALRGIVPICANCKSIRDSENQWQAIETLIVRHPAAYFSHTVCPKCAEKLYPDDVE